MTLKIHFQKLQIQKTKRLECTSKVHYLKNENNLQIHNIEHGVIYKMTYPIPSYKLYINTDAHEKQNNGIGNTQVSTRTDNS